MLSEDFCTRLEQALTTAFCNSLDRSLRGYFCDGILAPEWKKDYVPASVKHTKQIVTRAWIDEGRRRGSNSSTQRLYQLILLLGKQTYDDYMKKGQLTQRAPVTSERVFIDTATAIITVQLL
ncbi:hypothetical protein MUN82_10610 [Hymenobacter aerilatus]|uniref:Uncharacterized protein n=1 Tax=Hymenobacter aerilatus TaxID=2932251 RepID=A0A8T9T621_9BACT|nr:hypothetical protein [Hymenobacter aerilatus]UOR07526.1 hypothetical protein MUN82_10610 [Hymenobacter aerilatus]